MGYLLKNILNKKRFLFIFIVAMHAPGDFSNSFQIP